MIRQALAVFAALALASATGCGRSQSREQVAMDTVAATPAPDTSRTTERPPAVTKAPKTIDAVLAAHSDSLMAVPGVLGTAVGRCNGAPCIRVLVSRVNDEIRRRVPSTLEGYPVHIDVTGTIVPR
jgi:hypothetical protein